MAYSRLYIHMVWSTKHRHPLLTPEVKKTLFPYMGGIFRNQNAHVEIINGVIDHVHMLVRIPTSISVADVARQVKGSSSRFLNEQAGTRVLQWQEKYGAFSVNPKEIGVVRNYIANQERHHHKVSFQDELKTTLDEHEIEYNEQYMWD